MPGEDDSKRVYQDIQQEIEHRFHLHIVQDAPLQRGWLNLKWKVQTEKGFFVIKQFHKDRYQRYGLQKVSAEQQRAMQEQQRQYENGVPCPRLLTCDGEVIHTTSGGERFILMEFMPGENHPHGTLTPNQMFHLGSVTAQMHNLFNDGTHVSGGSTEFVPPPVAQRMEYWRRLHDQTQGNDRVQELIEVQMLALEGFDASCVQEADAGWCHRDLWADNILFFDDRVSAILDFDRFAYDFPELDIARAVMSGALGDRELSLQAVSAFMDGYRTGRLFAKGHLVRALQLLWYLESRWWIKPNICWERYQEKRFAWEMTWLADHLSDLPSLIGDL